MIGAIGTRQAAERPGLPKLSPPTAQQDVFVHVPQSMTMQDLRQVAQASMGSMQKAGSPLVDPNKIPFGVELEMENFAPHQAQGFIDGLPEWNVHPDLKRWKLTKDESLSSGGEAVSPPMTLENGQAEEQIRAVLKYLTGLKGKMTRNCGLHIHVDKSVLGEKGLTNLMTMVLEQEHALFRLSQNGFKNHRGTLKGNGYRHDTPYYYCKPLGLALQDPFPVLHAQSPNEFRNALYGAIAPDNKHARPPLPPVNSKAPFRPDHRDSVRYFGVNFNAYWYQGTIEFRLFEASADPEQVMENVRMVLGMIASAANGSYTYLQPHALGTQHNDPVSKEAFEYFLSRVTHTPKQRERLLKTFRNSGGYFQDDAPVTNPTVLQTAFLMRQGYKFSVEGKPVHSPLEIASLIERNATQHERAVSIEGPNESRPANLGGKDDLERLAAEVERSAAQSSAGGEHTAVASQFSALRDKGISFYTGGSIWPSWAPGAKKSVEIRVDTNFANRLKDGGVRAYLPHWTMWKGFPCKSVTLRNGNDVARLAQKYLPAAPKQVEGEAAPA